MANLGRKTGERGVKREGGARRALRARLLPRPCAGSSALLLTGRLRDCAPVRGAGPRRSIRRLPSAGRRRRRGQIRGRRPEIFPVDQAAGAAAEPTDSGAAAFSR